MNKLLLALGLAAALSAPALAGRLDADPSIVNNPAQLTLVPAAGKALTATRAARAPDRAKAGSAATDDPFKHGDHFGANSR